MSDRLATVFLYIYRLSKINPRKAVAEALAEAHAEAVQETLGEAQISMFDALTLVLFGISVFHIPISIYIYTKMAVPPRLGTL